MNEKKKNSGIFIACWFLLLILLLILFLVKKDTISGNLQKTDFFGKVFNSSEKSESDSKKTQTSTDENKKYEFDFSKKVYEEATGSENVKAAQEDAIIIPTSKEQENQAEEKTVPAEKSTTTQKASPVQKTTPVTTVKQTESILYFVAINSDGSISRKQAKRTMKKSESPLTDSINALLSGPTLEEEKKGYKNLIPAGTRLLGASVKNGIATLNFNEQFEFNPVGSEGHIAQLMQIVFTATEFPTVKSVQILIEGEKKDFLGSEGQWIGSPLARTSF